MPVLFNCLRCRGPIRASRRKSGTTVACPECGQANVVPTVPLREAAPAGAGAEAGFDDIPELISIGADVPPTPPAISHAAPVAGALGLGSYQQRPHVGPASRGDDALLVITRRGVYAMGTLLLTTALVFLS